MTNLLKRTLALLCTLALLLSALPMSLAAEPDSAEFAILSTTDMHGKCWDTNVLTDGTESNNMLKVKTAVNQIRTELGEDNVFLVDNGDLYQGTPVSSVQLNQYTQGLSDDPLAMALCLADIGYDAASLGNHEFNYTWKTMEDARSYLLENGVSTICGNLYYEATGKPVFQPYITRDVTVGDKTLKIGILGLESTDCPRWDVPDNYPGIIFHHPDNPECSIAWEVNYYVPKMKEAGCDFIVVAYHGGTGSTTGDLVFGTNTEGQASRMIAQTEGVDMVIAGHDHSASYSNTYLKNKNGEDVLIVNGGGTQLTKSVFTAKIVNGNIEVSVKSTQNLSLSGYASDADLKAKITPYAQLASEYVNREAGKAIGTWDTETNYYLKQSDSMDLIQAAQMYEASKYIAQKYGDEEGMAYLLEEYNLDHTDVDMSSTSVVTNGSYYVKAGSLTMKDIYRLYKYDNNLYILPMTGAQIKAVLEQNASTRLRATIKNGTVSYSTIGENFTNPVFGGINFTYDMYQPEGSRVIIEGFSNGRAFDPNKTYLVGVNNYHLGNTGCGFGAYSTADALWSQTDDLGGGVVQDLIMEYLTDMTAEKGGVDPATFNWSWKLDYTGDVNAPQTLSGDIIAKEVSEIHDGDQIMIYSPSEGVIMSLEPAENTARLGGVAATAVNQYIGTNAPAAIFTVEIVDENAAEGATFALKTASGNYLTSGATGNSLGYAAELTELGTWYLEEAEGGFHIRNVGAAYNDNHNQAIEWYSGFTTYGVQSTAAFLLNLYTPVETASLASEVKDGGKYIIFHDAESTCLSTTANAGGLAPVSNTYLGGKIILPVAESTLIVTANVGQDGKIEFVTDDGRYLTAPAAGNGLSLENAPAANELSLWTLTAVEGGWHVMSVGAAYNGNHNQALEYYSGKFTTYGVKNTGEYLYNFYELTEQGEVPPAPCEHKNTELRNAAEATCTENGYSGDTYCTDCGELIAKGAVLKALGHAYKDEVIAPTCTEAGCTLHTCSRCNDSYKDTETAALGHNFVDGVCTRCGAKDPNYQPPPFDCDGGKDCPAHSFSDVKAGSWYHEAVDYALKAGLMNGMGDGKFDPDGSLTRAMLVTILYRAEGSPNVSGKANPFTDVKSGQWYTDAVIWAAHEGIVNGMTETTFAPNLKITREQIATILYRYAGSPKTDGSLDEFSDALTVSPYAIDAMTWAVEEGIINGMDGKLAPKDNATRAQIATLLMRYLEK